MTFMHAVRVALRHPTQPSSLLSDVSFDVNPGDRIGLIGPNGAGKTTLLRLMAGELEPAAGGFALQRGLRLGYVPQESRAPSGLPLEAYLLGADPPLADLYAAMQALGPELVHPEAALQHAQLLDDYGARGGYAFAAEIERVLAGLGFTPAERVMPMGQLSSGQRSRAELAKLLLVPADVLLIDEPTNHLDLPAREWLEGYLAGLAAACVVVSHDRVFLNRTVSRIWELQGGTLTSYEGDYEGYRTQRAVRERQAWEAYEGQQRRIKAARQAAEKREQLAKRVATTPEGQGIRTGKDFYKAKAARIERTARILRERRHHEPEAIKPRSDEGIPVLDFARVPRSGDVPLTVQGLGKTLAGKALFANLTFEVGRGERLAVVGPNGAGKTTLLRLILGTLAVDGGVVSLGANVRLGHYAQEGENLDPAQSPLAICQSPNQPDGWARTVLACLKVRGDQVNRPVGQMSAGERSKVALARLLLSGANVLLLDEPTNHLDLDAREALEGTLAQFPGTIVFVSHDRYFIDALADRVLVLGD